jgi:hypothetical protein
MTAERSVKQHHDEWLNLLERSGPFLTVPVLSRVWPARLDPITSDVMAEFRQSFDKWREDMAGDQRGWIDFVLAEFLDWRDFLAEGPNLNPTFELVVPEHSTTVRADFAFVSPDATPRLLGVVLPPDTRPQARTVGSWSASAADRLALLLRRHQVPIGLATDGRWWALVWAPSEGATSVSVWDGALWLEERQTLAAFRCLLERRRFLGVPDADTLPELLTAGLAQQEEITVNLGQQVRRAVEMLVEAIGRAGRHGGAAEQLLAAIAPAEIYHGAVTVMMRLLFLLFAEERLLLPADDELYLASYSAGRLVDDLRLEASLTSEEALELRTAAWQRLLSLFRGVHGGIAHDRVHIRAYGGVVFDPDRHPWLEGRSAGQSPDNKRVLPIDDRTVLHALEALQYVTLAGERRRLSFRTLDVEQIGYVYEGLLGYDALRADEPVLGVVGRKGQETEVSLSEIAAIGRDADTLAARIDTKPAQVAKLLAKEVDLHDGQLLRVACSGDEELMTRIHPYFHLLREDLRGLPVVIPAGGLYVTDSPRRRLSGTHYTPRDLAEKVVIGTLEPLVFSPGPLDTNDRTAWRHRSSAEILSLKVADIAMGSGAFLVSACRYLAGALLEAWAAEGDVRAIEHLLGETTTLSDSESDPVVIDARREIIEHCLYGGDINEMAVEMAKLSLWLVSLSRERPFSFLDDRLVCGDSLLGLTSMDQLRLLHLDPGQARKEAGDRGFDLWGQMRTTLDEVERLRRDIAQRPLLDVRDAQIKEQLLREAEDAARPLCAIADALVGAAMAGEDLALVAPVARDVLRETDKDVRELRIRELTDNARYNLDTDRPDGAFERHPTHWPLVFPEVFEAGGFDAVVGNPPFLGGRKISGALGDAYREFLVRVVARGTRGGAADLLAYFLLLAHRLLNDRGQTGLIGTNTMAQGDTREVGLDQITADGVTIRGAVKSAKWPTKTVSLEYSVLWSSRRAPVEGVTRVLDGIQVPLISSSLDRMDTDLGQPFRLVANRAIAFQGSIVLGMGFTMSPDEAKDLIDRNPLNADVLFPFIGGEDLTGRPDFSASRWIVDFRDRDEGQARQYPESWAWVEERVKPDRLTKDRSKYPRMVDQWWQHWNMRPELYQAIKGMPIVIAITLHSKAVAPAFLPSRAVFSHALAVFALSGSADLALLTSSEHYWWAVTHGSTLENRIRYTATDVFETFPRPSSTTRVTKAGESFNNLRQRLMIERRVGLTALDNQVHSRDVDDTDIARLREIHVEIDQAVVEAYGWADVNLDHGFHQTAQGVRFTIYEPARREILRRLLELNHQRHADEVDAGLTGKGRPSKRTTGQMELVEG